MSRVCVCSRARVCASGNKRVRMIWMQQETVVCVRVRMCRLHKRAAKKSPRSSANVSVNDMERKMSLEPECIANCAGGDNGTGTGRELSSKRR